VTRAAARDAWVVDSSIALKWFLPVEQEPDGELARSFVGVLAMRTTTLAVYEVGNILIRQGGWGPQQVMTALALLSEICGDLVELTPEDQQVTAHLAQVHDLTFYDASYAAIAQRLGRGLLSAVTDLLDAGLATGLRDVPQS
jgi:predicted nucleic acid-binding protein